MVRLPATAAHLQWAGGGGRPPAMPPDRRGCVVVALPQGLLGREAHFVLLAVTSMSLGFAPVLWAWASFLYKPAAAAAVVPAGLRSPGAGGPSGGERPAGLLPAAGLGLLQ